MQNSNSLNTGVKNVKELEHETVMIELKSFILFQLWTHVSGWSFLNSVIIWGVANHSGFYFC